MARCKFSAFCLSVLVLLSLSAGAQSSVIFEQGINFYGNYRDDGIDVVGLVDEGPDSYDSRVCISWRVDDCSTLTAEGQANAHPVQNPANQGTTKNSPKEIELEDVIFNETGGLRADPKAKPGGPGSAENLHDARVAIAEVAERVLESSHPEREQAPHILTRETVRDLNAGNKDVARALDDSLSAARSHSNTTSDAMHFRTGRHKFRSLYGQKGTMYFGPFHDVTGGRRYLTIAP